MQPNQFNAAQTNLTPQNFPRTAQPFDTPTAYIKRPIPSKSPITKEYVVGVANPLGVESGVQMMGESKQQQDQWPMSSPFKI